MIKNKVFKKIIFYNLKIFLFCHIFICENLNKKNIKCVKYNKNDYKIIFFKSKKYFKNDNNIFYLNSSKKYLLSYFKKTKSIKEKLILINSQLKNYDNSFYLNILILNEDNVSSSNNILGFNSLFFLKKTYIQNGLVFCYIVHKWQNFNTAMILSPSIIFKNSLDLIALKVISNFIKYISITSILFVKNCNDLNNFEFSLTSIKTYLEKFITHYLIKYKTILVIPLNQQINFKKYDVKYNGILKNIYYQFKHTKILTSISQQGTFWNIWINIYNQIIMKENKFCKKKCRTIPLFDLKISKKISSIIINILLMIFIELCIDFMVTIDDYKLIKIINQIQYK
uniref:Uncharacterized protein n=1 Tax=Lotharella vacuolata TaxID=74820 RepID=A0A0H5BHJ4_9EUKA|nr:hypothetical protein [Lotharella vacuolata]